VTSAEPYVDHLHLAPDSIISFNFYTDLMALLDSQPTVSNR